MTKNLLNAFVLILASTFLSILVYISVPAARKAFPLENFNRDVEIVLGGDVMLGRTVMTKSLISKDPSYPFTKIASELFSADLAVVNLENPIIKNCPETSKSLIFCAVPEMVKGLTRAGIDVVNLANNHTLNYGPKGLEETKEHLSEENIEYVGVGNLVTKNINGTEFGFLGFDFLTNPPKQKEFDLVAESAKKVRVLVVSVHRGAEYKENPTEEELSWMRKLVDNGASIVFGHGPHWVQGSEAYKEGIIYYSLGNLVFDQMWSQKTREGLLVRLTFRDGKLLREENIKTYMEEWAQPEVVVGE